MTNIFAKLQSVFKPAQAISPGMYHYISPPDDPRNYRLHLRVEENGNGVLIINASTILHLNQTATEYAYYLINNSGIDEVGQIMTKRYDINASQAVEDYQELIDRIQILINTPDLDPVSFLDLNRIPPFSGQITAPYRLDCAITYRLPPGVNPDAAPTERVDRELNTDDWLTIIDKAAELGIPHLVFTGGEPTLRNDLLELLIRAEENNQVTGLLSTGQKIADQAYLDDLLLTGLDHLMLILSENDEQSWIALENALAADLYVAVHLTLEEDNAENIENLVIRLAGLGVPAVSLSAVNVELESSLNELRELVAENNVDLVWNLPVPYSAMNPVDFETGLSELREGEGRAWLYIEPDGDVLPTQGDNRVLGNFIEDEWGKIWSNALSN